MTDVIIGIPTYFAGQMLTNCITAVLTGVPDAKIFIYKNEIGWLKACNYIMQNTQSDIILLNDDTIPLGNFVHEMKTLAYTDDKIAIVGAKMLAPNQETVINYGIHVAVDGNTAHKHYGESKDAIKHVEVQKSVEGSCFYIKREAIKRLGYLDEKYGMGYRAEVDYCFRAREVGWKVVSCPTAEVVHFQSQTAGRLDIQNDTYKIFMDDWGTKLSLGKV